MQIFCVYDNKAKSYATPFPQKNEITAVRAFSMEVNRADAMNPIHQHPGDFDLYHIGNFDDNTGRIEAIDPAFVVNAQKLVKE